MFQFPPYAPHPTSLRLNHGILLPLGFPIRTPPGQRLFGSSPDSFVAFTVLLRQHVPRHPPRALSRLLLLILSNRSLPPPVLVRLHPEFSGTPRLFPDRRIWSSSRLSPEWLSIE